MKYLIRNNKGFSLLEILLVLGIAAIFTTMSFMVASKKNYQQEIDNIKKIKENVISFYSVSPNYTGLTTETGIKNGLFSKTNLKQKNNKIINSLNGNVSLSESNGSPSGESGSSFMISYKDIPYGACRQIIYSTYKDFYKIEVNNKIIKETTNNKEEINSDQINEICSENNNDIDFISL